MWLERQTNWSGPQVSPGPLVAAGRKEAGGEDQHSLHQESFPAAPLERIQGALRGLNSEPILSRTNTQVCNFLLFSVRLALAPVNPRFAEGASPTTTTAAARPPSSRSSRQSSSSEPSAQSLSPSQRQSVRAQCPFRHRNSLGSQGEGVPWRGGQKESYRCGSLSLSLSFPQLQARSTPASPGTHRSSVRRCHPGSPARRHISSPGGCIARWRTGSRLSGKGAIQEAVGSWDSPPEEAR